MSRGVLVRLPVRIPLHDDAGSIADLGDEPAGRRSDIWMHQSIADGLDEPIDLAIVRERERTIERRVPSRRGFAVAYDCRTRTKQRGHGIQ